RRRSSAPPRRSDRARDARPPVHAAEAPVRPAGRPERPPLADGPPPRRGDRRRVAGKVAGRAPPPPKLRLPRPHAAVPARKLRRPKRTLKTRSGPRVGRERKRS